ncbi:MAG TPA: carbohydrate binding domain-containing protein, partial [Herpetosiphonaceae bacterium]
MKARRPLSLLLALLLALLSALGPRSAPTSAEQLPPLPQVDDFEAPLATGQAGNIPIGFFVAQDGGSTTTFGRTATPPAPVPGAPGGNNVLQANFTVVSYGVVIHGFENAAVNEWVSQDWSPYAGFSFWLYGLNSGTDLFIDLIDNRNAGSTTDDAERFTATIEDDFSGWRQFQLPFTSFLRKDIGNGAPNDGFTLTEVHGWALGALTTGGVQRTYYMDDVRVYGVAPPRPLTVGFTATNTDVPEGATASVALKLSKVSTAPVTVNYSTAPAQATPYRDYLPVTGTVTFPAGTLQQTIAVPTIDDNKYEADEGVLISLTAPVSAELGIITTGRVNIRDSESYDPLLLDDFERDPTTFAKNGSVTLSRREILAGAADAFPGQGAYEGVLDAAYPSAAAGASFGRKFPQGLDLRGEEGLSFWHYGRNTGQTYKLQLRDNSTADPGPAGWQLAWSDEFNDPAGTPPNPATWTHEIGDGTSVGNIGWGNSELQYYTNSTANSATDGAGNLVITTRDVSGTTNLRCYYGPCRFTSARLISANKAEFAYGRIESRFKTPRGAGMWPAIWALGDDIARVNWPQTGEIDIMEFVGRQPKEIFGTLHGPGYSGGNAYGDTYTFADDVPNDWHTVAIDWQPNSIKWYVDGIEYHSATPADVAPNQWVYNHPFFLILNTAIGGNFGGPVGSNVTFPQEFKVDYIRVFQAPDTAERFEAPFVDNYSGWRRVVVPFSSFARSASQPTGAPNDGLNLRDVTGYGFALPANQSGTLTVDQVRVKANCADEATVISAAANGAGSLRDALARVCAGATVRFAPALANQTIALTGELALAKSVTIDGSDAPGLSLSGEGTHRVLVVNAQVSATVKAITLTNGYGFELAGGVLNNGNLTLDHVTVTGNRVATSGADFWKGGAGIYSGENSRLTVLSSLISDNAVTQADGGGIFAFFGSTVTISATTVYSNSSTNVAGGLRLLGSGSVVNSTLSGNRSTGWHGGALFLTDGTLNIRNTTIISNSAPSGTAGGLFVGTFGASNATLTLENTIVAGNTG